MSDMIRREDAIKATWKEPSYAYPLNVLTEVRDRINALPTVSTRHRVEELPKWVSVFDDLPRKNAVVVVSDGKRSWDVGQYHFLFKADDRTIWWWKKHTTRKVLWWMYKEDAIPEPPKEG